MQNDNDQEDGHEPDSAPDLIPARMLNEVVYCPRLFYLERVAGEWADSADTVNGQRVHRRVDEGGGTLPDVLTDKDVARSVSVSSAADGIIAVIDIVETVDGAAVPVDYKRGDAPDPERVPGDVWAADRVQIGAHALGLRASGYRCDEGAIYYAGSRRRVRIAITDALVAEVREAVDTARRIQRDKVPPPPLVSSPKCPRCSLAGICLPDETHALDRPEGQENAALIPIRRLLAPRDDAQPLYVQDPGSTIGRTGHCLEVRARDGTKTTVRLREISHVSVFGAVQLTHAAMQSLLDRGIGVSYFSTGGWHYGFAGAFAEKNVFNRIAQFGVAADVPRRLALARVFVSGKILNARTLLRRNDTEAPEATLSRLKRLAALAGLAQNEQALLGIEGSAARIYFERFAEMLTPRSGGRAEFEFNGRNRRPPRDPVNALLSFAYALLVKDARIALVAAGLDPTVGFLHHPRHGRPALALDLMEEFRPLIADSVVLTAVNTEVVEPKHFVRSAGAVALTDAGRRAFLGAYERRMDHEVTHPVFGYTLSYRRVLEVQARLLSRAVSGEISRYPAFRTR